jgi:branched-chain amino acid aminotransferase
MSEIKQRVTYHSGEWIPESEASIHIYDSQFMYGDGVFEMARTFNHKFFLLEEHIDRLFRSMKYLQIPITKTKEEVRSLCEMAFEKNKDHFPRGEECRVMINVSRGPLGIYKEVFKLSMGDNWNRPTWIVNVWPLSKTAKILGHFYETGVNAVIPSQRQIPSRLLENKVKNRSRFHYQVANLQVANLGNDVMPLLLDEDGFVTESTGANFLIIKDEKIVTPELRNMLRGSSMMYVIEVLAPQIGLEVVHKNFEPYDVLNCDEAMFTGTFVNLLPCNRLNGQYFNDSVKENPIGPITQKICDAWSKNVGVDFLLQIKDWSKGHHSMGISSAMLGSEEKDV